MLISLITRVLTSWHPHALADHPRCTAWPRWVLAQSSCTSCCSMASRPVKPQAVVSSWELCICLYLSMCRTLRCHCLYFCSMPEYASHTLSLAPSKHCCLLYSLNTSQLYLFLFLSLSAVASIIPRREKKQAPGSVDHLELLSSVKPASDLEENLGWPTRHDLPHPVVANVLNPTHDSGKLLEQHQNQNLTKRWQLAGIGCSDA